MPFDSEGNFTRVHNWDEDRQNDIDIASDRMDEEFDNYATALNDCVLRDGRATLIGDLDLGTFKIKNMAKGNNPQDAVNREQLDELRTQVFSGDNEFAGHNVFNGETEATTLEVEDSSTKLATSEFVKNVLKTSGAGLATFGLDTNGYVKFDNGLIVQWGEYRGSDGNITFPTPFIQGKYSIVAASLLTGNQTVGWLQVGTKNTDSCYCQMHNYENSHHATSTNTPFNWIAIGV